MHVVAHDVGERSSSGRWLAGKLSLRATPLRTIRSLTTRGGAYALNAATTAGGGSDQPFVNDLCKAADRFTKEIGKANAGPTVADPSKALEQVFKSMSGPMATFASELCQGEAAEGPRPVACRHVEATGRPGEGVEGRELRDPSLASLSDSPIADMPKDAETRLSKLAANADGGKGTAVFPK